MLPAIKNANPHVDDPEYFGNCTRSAIATFLRRRGYDVTAGKVNDLYSPELRKLSFLKRGFSGYTQKEVAQSDFASFETAAKTLKSLFGNDAEGIISVAWDEQLGGGGHAFNWGIKDGKVLFFDGQRGRPNSFISKNYFSSIKPGSTIDLARLDNAIIKNGIFDFIEQM